MSNTPRACPNLGIDCGFPDCVYDVAECAEVNAEPEPPLEGAPAPPSARGPFPPRVLAPITADDIFGRK